MKVKDFFMASGYASGPYRKISGRISSLSVRKLLRIIFAPFGMIKYGLGYDVGGVDLLSEPRIQLTVVAIVKNEALYIEEWILFHLLVGVDKFIIYDNESTDGTYDKLEKYIKKGVVTYNKLKGKQRQCDAYNDAVMRYRDKSRFMLFMDVDEFIISLCEDEDIADVCEQIIKKNDRCGGIAVNWRIFGSNGHKTHQNGLVIENFTACAYDDFEANKLYNSNFALA